MIHSAWKSAVSVFMKDVRSELRTRYAINALLMFIITTLAIVLFSISSDHVSPDVLSGVLWIMIFFSSMSGLSRAFISEEERGTVLTLQLMAKPLPVFFGKLLFNVVLLSVLNILTVVLYLTFMTDFLVKSYDVFVITFTLGTFGLAATATIIAALISKANNKGTLYPVLSFPILLPLLLTVIQGTRLAVEGAPMKEALSPFQVLIAYLVVIVTASYLLFEYIWKD